MNIKYIYNVIDKRVKTNELVRITCKRNNIMIISEEDRKTIEETLYLNTVPDMTSSIKDSMNAADSEFTENIEW